MPPSRNARKFELLPGSQPAGYLPSERQHHGAVTRSWTGELLIFLGHSGRQRRGKVFDMGVGLDLTLFLLLVLVRLFVHGGRQAGTTTNFF